MLKNRERMGNKGLTLIELLVTIAVLAIVAAIAIPVVTNVVGSTNERAATQTQSDITDFVEKYKKSGAYTYSDGVFSGYVDLNGDGTASDDEKIEELVVDTTKFAITPDGDTPPSDTAGDFYGTTPNTTFAVEEAAPTEVTGVSNTYNIGSIHWVGHGTFSKMLNMTDGTEFEATNIEPGDELQFFAPGGKVNDITFIATTSIFYWDYYLDNDAPTTEETMNSTPGPDDTMVGFSFEPKPGADADAFQALGFVNWYEYQVNDTQVTVTKY